MVSSNLSAGGGQSAHLLHMSGRLRALLVEIAVRHATRPVCIDPSQPDVPVDRGKRPIHRPCDQPVFDRIAPTVGEMRAQVGLVTDGVFPEATLPNPTLPLA